MGISNKKILVLTSTYPRWKNDSEPSFVHNLNQCLTENFDVYVLCPHFDGAQSSEILDDVHVHRFRYAPAPLELLVSGGGILSNLKRSLWKWLLVPIFLGSQFLSFLILLKRIRPDAIHVHWIIPQGVVALIASIFIKMPPLVLTSHGVDIFGLRSKLWVYVRAVIVNRVSHITVVSQHMKTVLLNETNCRKAVSVVSMGVDLVGKFTECEGVKRDSNTIIFVGRLVEKKGVLQLLGIFEKIVALRPDVILRVLGDGPEREKLETITRQKKITSNVMFVGPVSQDDLVAEYRSAGLCVLPFVTALSGDQEGLGLVSLEAIGCGCPVMVGNVPAVLDIFTGFEEFLFDPNALEGSVTRILSVMQDFDVLRPKFELLRSFCIEKYSWQAIAREYSNIFHEVLE